MQIIQKLIKSTAFPAFILVVVMVIINIRITKGFLSGVYINSFFSANAPLICLAIGISMVIITGGIDLSVGGLICLCNVTMVSLFGNGWSVSAVVLIGMMIAAGGGVLNGMLVAIFRINPMMATFSTQSMFAGLALWVMDIPGGRVPTAFAGWFAKRVFGVMPMSLIVILLLILLVFLLMKTPLGVRLYAIGFSEEKAYISGIRVVHIKFFAYTFSGIAAGIAAICYTARTGGGDPTAAMTLTLSSIAACVIGGLSLAGGKGTFIGGLWGALFLQMIISIILSMRIQTMTQDLVRGLIIFAGIAGTIIVFDRKLTKGKKRIGGEGAESDKVVVQQ